jgi:hypothetical protein
MRGEARGGREAWGTMRSAIQQPRETGVKNAAFWNALEGSELVR